MSGWVTPLLFFLGVIVSSVVTYLIARRKNSGSISTSDAASLWEESNNLRREYRERAEELEKQLADVSNRLQIVMDELGKLRINHASMLKKITELKNMVIELRRENTRLIGLMQKKEAPA